MNKSYSAIFLISGLTIVSAAASANDTAQAPALTLEQAKLQAKELGITLDDFRFCPCGDAFSRTRMASPPWMIDSLSLYAGMNTCVLRAIKKGSKTEALSAFGSRGAKQTNCRARVGLAADKGRVDYTPFERTQYSQQSMQACYNIIGAKARQWLSQGGDITLVSDPTNNPRKAKKVKATMDNLKCPVAGK